MKLIKIDEVENLSFEEIKKFFSKNINKTKTNFLTSFSFGNDLVKYAEGINIYTYSGKKIYDFTAGVGVLSHGHNHPRIINARIKFQKKKKMEVNKSFLSPYLGVLSNNLSKILPDDLNYSFFPNSGSEAIDTALKTSFVFNQGKRKKILSSDIAFHGKNLSSIAISSSPEINFNYPNYLDNEKYQFNNFESLQKLVEMNKKKKEEICAIIVEPLSISTLRENSESFLKATRKLCDENNIVLIFDEIYSGWAKTGYLFNFMKCANLIPDILCTAKTFGGGKSSISGVVIREKIHKKCFENPKFSNLLTSTYYGFGEETATAIEAVNIIIEDNYVGKAKEIEKKLKKIFFNLLKNYDDQITSTKTFGTYSGIFLNNKFKKIQNILSLIPVNLLKDEYFIPKLLSASVIDRLYEKHNILSLISFSYDTHIIISPPHIVNDYELGKLEKGLNETFKYGVINCTKDFILNKLKSLVKL